MTLRLWRTVREAINAIGAMAQLMLKSGFSTPAEGEAAKGLAETAKKIVVGLDKASPKTQANRITKAMPELREAQVKSGKNGFEKLEKLIGTVIAELELARQSSAARSLLSVGRLRQFWSQPPLPVSGNP